MSNIAICLGDAAHPGTFLPPTFVNTPTASVDSISVGDLNGDGLPDLIVGDSDNNYAAVLPQDPAHPGTFLTANHVGATQAKPLIAEMNHDGTPDIVLFPGNAQATVLLGNPQNPGSFLTPAITQPITNDIHSVAIADMNNDGLPDIVISNTNAKTVSVLLNDANHPGNLLPRVDYPTGASVFDLAVGDLNHDGIPDVVLGGVSSGVIVLLGSTSDPGQLMPPQSYPATATPAGGRSLGVAIGDIDGDGIPDIVSGNYGPVFDLLLGNGDGTFKPAAPLATCPTPSTFEATSMAIGDVDGDGLNDVVVGQFYQNSVQIFLHQPSALPLAITATDLSPSATSVVVGSSVTITVKVSSFTNPPTGSVTLYESTGSTFSPIATLTLDGIGTATYTTTALQVGSHNFKAHFPGDTIYAPSISLVETIVVNNVPTVSMTLSGTPNPDTLGENVALTATIKSTGPTPTGSVTLLDSGSVIGTAPLNSTGVAVFNTTSLTLGIHTITAVYGGDSNYDSRSATLTEVIRYPAATISLTSSLNPAPVGQSITFTAKVMEQGWPAPTSNVIFKDNGRQIAQVSLAADGSATFSTSALTFGSHTIQAVYSGDANYDSQSTSLIETVNPGATVMTLTVSPNPAFAGRPVTLQGHLNGLGIPPGSATFFDGSTPIGTIALDDTGTAVLTTSQLQVGTHPLTATFTPNTISTSFTSTVVDEVIIPTNSDYKLTTGDSLTLITEHHGTATVTATALGGLSDTVSLTCGSLPQYVTCQVTPAQINITDGTPQNITVHRHRPGPRIRKRHRPRKHL
jgi:Bacterial Ig-like domain (group 3)/FG-GAP-like repeat/FG-GAP repeat